MISLVFTSSGVTPPMLAPVGEYFLNLGATLSFDVNVDRSTLASSPVQVGKDILPSSLVNVGEDALPSSLVNLVASPAVINVATTAKKQLEEGEIGTLAS
jgi:hypothetical protein